MATLLQQKAYERAVRLHNRAAKCQSAGEPLRPERLYLRSLSLKEQLFGPDHLEVGLTLNNLGLYYKSLGRLADARQSYLRALAIFQTVYGGSHASVGDVLYNLAQLMKKEAEAFESRSRMIEEAVAELSDPQWRQKAVIRHDLARYRLEAGPSRIHRFGVFAAETIPAGEAIIEYTGERVSRRDWIKRTNERTYLMRLDRYWCIDGSVGGTGAELINHCCEPNCKFARPDVGDRRQAGVWVTSLRDIPPGEELLLDYSVPRELQSDSVLLRRPSLPGDDQSPGRTAAVSEGFPAELEAKATEDPVATGRRHSGLLTHWLDYRGRTSSGRHHPEYRAGRNTEKRRDESRRGRHECPRHEV